jgi:hypothetical protein
VRRKEVVSSARTAARVHWRSQGSYKQKCNNLMSSFPVQIFSGVWTTDAICELAAKADSSEDSDKINSLIVAIVFCA